MIATAEPSTPWTPRRFTPHERAAALRAVNADPDAPASGAVKWWHMALAYGAIQAISFVETGDPRRQQRKYVRQDKPSWAPPPWLFGPAWSVLTIAMLYGDRRLLNDRDDPSRGARLAAHGAAWASYFAFTPAYFRADSPVLGPAVSGAMAAASATAVALAWRRGDRRTALAWLPVALWTAYATALSVSVARRNPDAVVGDAAMRDESRDESRDGGPGDRVRLGDASHDLVARDDAVLDDVMLDDVMLDDVVQHDTMPRDASRDDAIARAP